MANPYPPLPGYHWGEVLYQAAIRETEFLAQHGNHGASTKLKELCRGREPLLVEIERQQQESLPISRLCWILSYLLPDDWVLPRGYYD